MGNEAGNAAAAAVLREAVDVLRVSKFYANRGSTPTGRVFVELVIAQDGAEPGVVRAHAVRSTARRSRAAGSS